MKRILLILLVAIIPFSVMGQLTFNLNGTITKKISSDLLEGSPVSLKSIEGGVGFYKVIIVSQGSEEIIDIKKLENISFEPSNSKEFWQIQALKHDVYKNITKNGMQYKLRIEIEEEALDYINYTENNNLLFKDSYLESYLYALAYKIYPIRLEDGRPGNLNIKILKSVTPNAFIFPNGTMYITTGLLSTINSEEELIGVMAHEISHFVLDHSMMNINKITEREKRAKFWANLLFRF